MVCIADNYGHLTSLVAPSPMVRAEQESENVMHSGMDARDIKIYRTESGFITPFSLLCTSQNTVKRGGEDKCEIGGNRG